jgi:hypothetical protein
LTFSLVQVAPPSSEVRITPCPDRVASRVLAVLPTAVQVTSGSPAVGLRVEEVVGEELAVGTELDVGTELAVGAELDVGEELEVGNVGGAVRAGAPAAPLPVGACATQEIPLR